MAIYAIGDVQGCYDELCRLLEKISFDPASDQLWFCGDLVNRGPQSLETLRFVKSLGSSAISVLGNHDLHLLALAYGIDKARDAGGLQTILHCAERDDLLDWLQARPMLHYDKRQKTLLVHAGVHPDWTLKVAKSLAAEVEAAIRGNKARRFFKKMYGNQPRRWSNELTGYRRLRTITNIFTRMRYFTPTRMLNFNASGSPRQVGKRLTPWFELESSLKPEIRVLFGHWSTLPVGAYGRHFALDGGCVWGEHLVALRIDDATEHWFFVDSYTNKPIQADK